MTAPPLDIDPMPGGVNELLAIAADPAAGNRGLAALEKVAAILRGPFDARARVDATASTVRDAGLDHRHSVSRSGSRARAPPPLRAHAGRRREPRAHRPMLVAALDASSAIDEADALRRHIACPTRFAYAPGLDGTPAPQSPLPQDHDRNYWDIWESIHPRPLDQTPPAHGKSTEPRYVAQPDGPASLDADTRYVALYTACPDDADPAHAESHALAWIAVARAHRSHDARGGPFVLLRAIEAYEKAIHAAAAGAPGRPAMRHARLELGETLHDRARHHAAAEELARALALCEDAHACTPAERETAVSLLADSLTYVEDYEGPPADAPVIERPDLIDTEPRIDVVAAKLRLAVDRAVDPALIPKGRAFAADVLAAIAQTFDALNLFDDAILALDTLRQRFPTHWELPRVAQAIAREHGKAARMERARTAAPRWARAVGAWDDLAVILRPGSPWRQANASDAEALHDASLRATEADAERAKALLALAMSLEASAASDGPLPMDDAAALVWFRRATDEWKMHAIATPDARFALAAIAKAALAWQTRAGTEVNPSRWADAWSTGLAARDDPDAKSGQPAAARALVDLADLHVRYEEKQFVTSHGKHGLAARNRALHAPFRARAEEVLPKAIEEAVQARDAIADDAASSADAPAIDALTSAAGILFAYGHASDAEHRLSRALARACKTRNGFDAFTLAAEVARAAHDKEELARLAALHADPDTTCARSPTEIAKGRALTR